jgi:4-amino-4-deoxy-L-arabinose transferase-like glycosyltransferase
MRNEQGTSWQLDSLFIVALCSYFGLHILLRVLISHSLDYDEAEQAFLAQWLLPGYTEQPPLYTWLQFLLFRVFGEGVLAVSLLKNGLLLLTYLFVFLSSRILFADSRRAILAAVSLLLIPQIGWESQRDMTHTTLVVMAAAATFWQVLRLSRHNSTWNYLLLGLFLGIGVLAKANFFLFLTSLGGAMLFDSQSRKVLMSPRILLAVGLALLMSGNYLWWMVHNQDIVFSATRKFKRAQADYYVRGLLSLASNSFLFLTPLWAVYLFLFPRGFLCRPSQPDNHYSQLIRRYIWLLLLLLALVVLAFKVTYVKDRWLQPVLFLFPLFFFNHVASVAISARKFRIFLTIILLCAMGIYTAFTIRVVGASYLDRFCRMNYPFDTIAETLHEDGFHGGLIISDNRFLAGNLRLRFADTIALIPEYRLEDRVHLDSFSRVIFVWKADNLATPPELLRSYGQQLYQIDINAKPIRIIEKPQLYGRGETVRLGVVSVALPPAPPAASARP